MNCLIIFYGDKLRKSISKTKKDDDDNICALCEEQSVTLMLECYV